MFKMMSLHSDACQKSLPPLIDGLIDDGLTEVCTMVVMAMTTAGTLLH